MKKDGVRLRLSPSDLINFTGSEFVTWMDRFHKECPGAIEPDPVSAEQKIIQDKGLEHEHAFVDRLAAQGKHPCNLSEFPEQAEPTLAAMRRGERIIYQGFLVCDDFAGYPDFLVRVESPSNLGAWSYEPWDTKLARHPKPYFLVQLCCYAEMLERVQGVRPKNLRVVTGAAGWEPVSFRTDDYFYYYRALKEAFLAQQLSFDSRQPPEIPPLTDLGRWSGYAERELAARDDLALVADIRTNQIHKLRSAGVTTTTQLAQSPESLCVPRMNQGTLRKLQRQAALQVASRGAAIPNYELVTPDESEGPRGLSLLPAPSASDVFFDMEGFPLIDDGREYLFGASFRDGGQLGFRDWWAHTPIDEKHALQSFVWWVHDRWQRDRSLHIYHYNHYEVTALRRLMGKYGVCELEIDDLLRGNVFVDLYRIVRQSVMIGEPSYSLKYVEHLYRGRRQGDVASAGASMVYYQRWLMAPDGDTPATSAILKQIRDYNEQDCQSTAELADWLRQRQRDAGIRPVPRPGTAPKDEEQSDANTDHARRHALALSMLVELPDQRPPGENGEPLRVKELLAYLLEFHRREEKPAWWARFDRMDCEESELLENPDCLAGLQRTATPPQKVKRSYLYEYTFDPRQETKVRADTACEFTHDWKKHAKIAELDLEQGRALLKVSIQQGIPPDRLSIAPQETLLGDRLAEAVEQVVNRWRENGRLPGALEDFLFRRRPRLLHNQEGSLVGEGIDTLRGAIDAALEMRATTLCIQGPPGSGKTFTGARMIAALLQAGKRVGIISNSHRAINVLLAEAWRAALHSGLRPAAVKVCKEEEHLAGLPPGIPSVESGRKLFESGQLPQLIGGTAYAFVDHGAEGTLDYLFVDEAGQVSVANLVAVAPAAKNIILLGDQMQLAQPIQGSHPGESGLSTLEYLLEGRATISPDFGIFLSRTWRLHPDLCHFISGAVYEDRLVAEAHTAQRVLVPGSRQPDWLTGAAGLVYIPVEHEGNGFESVEEEDRIADLVRDLLRMRLRRQDGTVRPVAAADILVVAPYNLQVRRLARRLPDLRTGSVDKFQGQEAPVVIFSMCASSGDSSPRGIDFLFSRNRLNVAISRAETLAILVASPQLIRTRCSSIEQMALVNVYCRAAAEGIRAAAEATAPTR
jgi:predicted RecB family nuclease